MKNAPIDRSYFLQTNPRLLDETLGEFSSKGYEAASLNEILKRSAFNKGSFYYRFSEKMDLFVALLETLFAKHAEELAADRRSIVEKESVRVTLALMVSTMYRLHDADRRHLDLYARIDDERLADRPELAGVIDKSPIEGFLAEASEALSAHGESAERISLFQNLARLVLYRIREVGRDDRGWIDPAVLADAVMNASFPGAPAAGAATDRGFGILRSESADQGSNTEFEYAKGEILALVGPRDLTRAVTAKWIPERRRPDLLAALGALLNPKEAERIAIRCERSLRWHLKRSGAFPDAGIDEVLSILGFSEDADVRFDRLPESKRRLAETAVALSGKTEPLVVADAFEGIGEPERKRICQMLLKRRDIGITIILSGTDLESALVVADRIAFVGRLGILKTVPAADLKARYGDRVVVVSYRDRGLSRLARFPAAAVGGTEFASFLKGKDVVSLETRSMTGAEIYRIETGEDLS